MQVVLVRKYGPSPGFAKDDLVLSPNGKSAWGMDSGNMSWICWWFLNEVNPHNSVDEHSDAIDLHCYFLSPNPCEILSGFQFTGSSSMQDWNSRTQLPKMWGSYQSYLISWAWMAQVQEAPDQPCAAGWHPCSLRGSALGQHPLFWVRGPQSWGWDWG